MIVETIAGIITVAKKLWELKEEFDKKEITKRDRISDYFFKISMCLEQAHGDLIKGIYPHGKCEEMTTYAKMMPEMIEDVIGTEKTSELTKILTDAAVVEHIYCDLLALSDDKEKLDNLQTLAEASGYFRALANTVKVGK